MVVSHTIKILSGYFTRQKRLALTRRFFFPSRLHRGSSSTRLSTGWAQSFVESLDADGRQVLEEQLLKYHKCTPDAPNPLLSNSQSFQQDDSALSSSQLRLVAFAHSLPFIGFGFLDNAIMIIAGEYVDLTFSTYFGFSTMAAAGFGNLVSDLCGIGLVGYVEHYCAKIGVRTPQLSAVQLDSSSVRRATTFGRVVGITIGCLLGMCPLLWFDASHENEKSEVH